MKFWPKGIFWVYERRRDFFGSRKKHRDFLGLYFSSAQINNCNFLLVWDFFGYAKKVGAFLGRQILKLGLFWV